MAKPSLFLLKAANDVYVNVEAITTIKVVAHKERSDPGSDHYDVVAHTGCGKQVLYRKHKEPEAREALDNLIKRMPVKVIDA